VKWHQDKFRSIWPSVPCLLRSI